MRFSINLTRVTHGECSKRKLIVLKVMWNSHVHDGLGDENKNYIIHRLQ